MDEPLRLQCDCGHYWEVVIVTYDRDDQELDENGNVTAPAPGTPLNWPQRCPNCGSKYFKRV